MTIYLVPLREVTAMASLEWRAQNPEAYRTVQPISREKQQRFFKRQSLGLDPNNIYWTLEMREPADSWSVGMGGLTNISWETRLGEISLVLNPYCRGRGYGAASVDAILRHGFKIMNLENIFGEVYTCNGALGFWRKVVSRYGGFWTPEPMPGRKYYNGRYYGSHFFNISKPQFEAVENTSDSTSGGSVDWNISGILDGDCRPCT